MSPEQFQILAIASLAFNLLMLAAYGYMLGRWVKLYYDTMSALKKLVGENQK